MIFYFTATGNSKYAAERIAAATGERTVDIGTAWKSGAFGYDVTGDARIGIVAPVFAGTLPGIVRFFIDKLTLTGYAGQYTYGVFTCGGSSGQEGAALALALSEKSMSYNGSFDLRMPDNFIVWSDVPPQAQLDATLAEADRTLEDIIAAVKAKTDGVIDSTAPQMPFFPNQDISTAAGTSKLCADEKCVSCGLCASICPMGVIKYDDAKKPVWEGACTMCLACLHRCPSGAINHGTDTVGKGRYVNPNVKL